MKFRDVFNEDVHSKIAALRSKTVDRGATPGEAASAKAKADELETKYGKAPSGSSAGSSPKSDFSKPPRNKNRFLDIRDVEHDLNAMAGPGSENHTVHAFDGHFFRGQFTVRGNDSTMPHMATAMHHWDRFHSDNHKAIFASKASDPKRLHLLWANGRHVEPGHSIEHESFNNNPGNDQHFTRGLSDWIDSKAPAK